MPFVHNSKSATIIHTIKDNMNGALEVAKNIKKILQNMTGIYRDRHKKLPFVSHAYRTSMRTRATVIHWYTIWKESFLLKLRTLHVNFNGNQA